MKLHVFAGLGALFTTFFINFMSYFLNVPPISATPPEGERAKRARLTREALFCDRLLPTSELNAIYFKKVIRLAWENSFEESTRRHYAPPMIT